MGKSVARVFVPGWTVGQVLGLVLSVGVAHDLALKMTSANSVMMAAGDEWWTGRRVLSVVAFEAQGGTNVEVSAWLEAGFNVNVKPRRFFPNSPVNRLSRAAADVVARLGANPDAVFVHT